LEPSKFDEFGSKVRLTVDEYCQVINKLVDSEEKDWHELRMKDQVNLTRDAIIEATMLKYAKQEYGLDESQYNGRDLNYVKRYDQEGRFIGEAVIITLTMISMMHVSLR
jgi:hypothetical protein